jgi:hypothetical protein
MSRKEAQKAQENSSFFASLACVRVFARAGYAFLRQKLFPF